MFGKPTYFPLPFFLTNTFILGWVSPRSQGGKQTRVVWMDAVDKLGAVGFDKSSMRQFMMWDPRNTAEPFHTLDLDQSAGAIMPFYDNDVNVRICVLYAWVFCFIYVAFCSLFYTYVCSDPVFSRQR